jgi:signal transduction histidine kinase
VKTSLSSAGLQDLSLPPLELVDVTAGPLFEENQRLRAGLAAERQRAEVAIRENAAKSRFLAAMSHELRTPLGSILGFSQLLDADAGGPLSEKQRRFVRHIEVSGRHLLSLINEVLDLAKVAAGEMEVDIAEVDVAAVAEVTTEGLRPLAEARRQVLVVAVPGPIAVRADSRRLRQALTNLLANAIRFTPDGGRIRVRAQRAGGFVEVSVTDTGIGIAEADQARVFEEFTQLEAGRSAGGTGLGLAVTRQLVEAMGGSVSLQSRLGQGSTFTLRLAALPGPSVGCF